MTLACGTGVCLLLLGAAALGIPVTLAWKWPRCLTCRKAKPPAPCDCKEKTS